MTERWPKGRSAAVLFAVALVAGCDTGGGGSGGVDDSDTGNPAERRDAEADSQGSGVDGMVGDTGPAADQGPPPGDGPVLPPDARPDDGGLPTDVLVIVGDGPVIVPDGAVACEEGATRACQDIVCAAGHQVCEGGVWSACVRPAELCNGLDDNCDDAVDEGFELGVGCTAGVGACEAAGVTVCTADGAGVLCGATPGAPQAEICNGVDDDCDGVADGSAEDGTDVPLQTTCYEGPAGTEGVGVCRAGVILCLDGAPTDCADQVVPIPEVCNGLDDDCDGLTDEGDDDLPLTDSCYDGPEGTLAQGLCRSGVHVCGPGGVYGPCIGQVVPAVEICDQADDDCNGQTDDVAEGCACEPGQERDCYAGAPETLGQGACTAGRQTCLPDGSTWGPCEGQILPVSETCDGADNDCDGAADDEIAGIGVECHTGVGVCDQVGTTICDPELGQAVCDAEAGAPGSEICDGIDNDCNGAIDDGLGVGEPCTTGVGACAAEGVSACGEDGGVVCLAVAAEPSPEVCDGVDNDCNGEADDGLELGTACTIGEGACAGEGLRVCDGQGGVVCSGHEGQGSPEVCDGLDNDCDGEIDNGNPGAGDSCATGQEGVCGEGLTACEGGEVVCRAAAVGGVETCNGQDDDCDGVVDDGPDGAALVETCYDGPAGTEGVGSCRGGIRACAGGAYGACQGQILPAVEFCDSTDNDCNGDVDDVAVASCQCQPGERRACYGGAAGTQNVGLCHGGTQTCNADGVSFGPCEGEVVPAGELCDGLDNDCNGRVDEAIPGVGAACTDGVGDCLARGVTFCNAESGEIECGARPGDPRPETCDSRDNDCNGKVDDGLGLSTACTVGVGACAATGVQVCGPNGGVVCSVQPAGPTGEICDGVDNDCDGSVDDGLGLGAACTAGVGACQRPGVVVCGVAGATTCGAQPGSAQAEACDGIDNDCDGAVDDGNPGGGGACNTGLVGACAAGTLQCNGGGLVCVARLQPAAETCDGVDNDCDGATDEDEGGAVLVQSCYTGPAGTQDVGECRSGFRSCVGGRFGACAGQLLPAAETCDGADNDCDGTVDNPAAGACQCLPGEVRDCYTGPAGTENVGLCHGGTQTCRADGAGFGACTGEVRPAAELCDNLDNDCDGARDDVAGVGEACTSGTGTCARQGQRVCDIARGALTCSAVAGQPSVETCDSLDNDCDGTVDDVAGLGEACQNGIGECSRAGNRVCDLATGALRCDAVAAAPQGELCDGLDNDCDGETDDGNLAGVAVDCQSGLGECERGGVTVCAGAQGIVCDAVPGAADAELCDGLDNDCDGAVDDSPVDAGGACTAGLGTCTRTGTLRCVAAELACDAVPGQPVAELCDQRDNDCDGEVDDGRNCTVYTTCLDAYAKGERADGIYRLQPTGVAAAQDVYCDLTTDEGGWTLVASTRGTTLNDESAAYYSELATLAPQRGRTGLWNGLKQMGDRFDLRFACRASLGQADSPMDVDLSFYRVPWYREIVTSTDAGSCFNETDGAGQDMAPPLRRNNLTGDTLVRGDQWNFGYFEGEDACGDTADFTVDFDDRGMGNNRSDGTDWGEDDGQRKCGRTGLATGQWFVFARERRRVAVLGTPVTEALQSAGLPAEELSYFDAETPAELDVRTYEAAVIGRYAPDWSQMTPELEGAIANFALEGGSLVTEADGASILMSGYDRGYAYAEGALEPAGLFPASIGGGVGPGPDTPVTQTVPTDNLFAGVPNPLQAGDGTANFFYVHGVDGPTWLKTVATFPGDGEIFPEGALPAIQRGRYCGGSVVLANFDYAENLAAAGVAALLANMGKDALLAPLPALEDPCPLPLRPDVMVCGTTDRNVAEFLRAGAELNLVSGCEPDATTQALLVPRSALTQAAPIDLTALSAYVRGGGIVLTEYGTSDEVFNAVFAANVPPGTLIGDCRNAVAPTVQFNPLDTFWDENRMSPPTANRRGCGFDLQGYPGITKLGGIGGQSVTLAYRDLGRGRVWLIEADWSRNTIVDATMDPTRGLMHYMITHRPNPYELAAVAAGEP